MELFHFSIGSHASLNDFLLFKHVKTTFEAVLIFASALVLLDSNCAHSSEKYLENRLHIVNEHLLKVFLLLAEVRILLLLPHLIYLSLIHI